MYHNNKIYTTLAPKCKLKLSSIIETDMAQQIPTELTSYLEKHIIVYYNGFDRAHDISHVRQVIEESLRLARHYDVNPAMVLTIAAYHDTGLCRGREVHHLASGEILQTDTTLRQWFTEEQIKVMKEAVEDHRASCGHAPRNIYGLIVAEADRCIEPEYTLRRAVQYGLDHYPALGIQEQYQRFKEHVRSKYGESGYLKLWIPQSNNAKQLAKLRRIISDEEKLYTLFDRLYIELTASYPDIP